MPTPSPQPSPRPSPQPVVRPQEAQLPGRPPPRTTEVVTPHHAGPRGWAERLGLVARGALIGAAEVVPGVSGGTIALIVGVYETLIRSAGHLVRAAVLLARGVVGRGQGSARADAARHARQVRWGFVLLVLSGMVVAVVLGARLIEPLLEDYPVQARAVFAGLIVASLVVPARMVGGRWRPVEVLIGLVAAAAAFGVTGLPPASSQDPSLTVVAVAAAFAICALVLPGVSGSFLLLTVGLYEPTIAAVNDRDLVYLGVFAAGAVVGLALFATGLQWLLEHAHRLTLVVMTGLMAGSLRALWPWQDEDRGLLAPDGAVLPVVLLAVAGAVGVLALIALEQRLERRSPTAH